jgi:hypothetical protein
MRHKLNEELQDLTEEHFDCCKKLNNNPEIKEAMMGQIFKILYNQMLRRAG